MLAVPTRARRLPLCLKLQTHSNQRSTLRMSTTAEAETEKLASFHTHLRQSKRILALLGAGLSASSGLPTFRGAGGIWRTHDATSLATPEAFSIDPSFVWQFYSYRRHMALNAQPNPAHFALAELAKRNSDFITLSQNVDGLSPRAGHPEAQLKLLHGSLYDIKCVKERKCGYVEKGNYSDPIVEALAIPQGSPDPTANTEATHDSSAQATNPLIRGLDISNSTHPLPTIPTSSLPKCPRCGSLLRPGVVWFGESLPTEVLTSVDRFLNKSEPLDLMLVIGTSGTVFPAAAYVEIAREKGARIAVVNPDPDGGRGLKKRDWFFMEDAARVLPEMFKPVIGEIKSSEI